MGWYDRRRRQVRDLSCGDTRIYLELEVRRVRCRSCGKVKRERLDFLAENPFYTKRFAHYVGRRCRSTTIKDLARELNLDWDTVKTLEKQYMQLQLAKAGTPAPVLQRLDSRHVMVVHGLEGLDEISISGETMVGELKDGEVREYRVHPRQFSMEVSGLQAIQVASGQESAEVLRQVLAGKPGPARDIVLLNAGAAIYVSGLAPSLEEGVAKARGVVDTGAARRKLDELLEFTNALRA